MEKRLTKGDILSSGLWFGTPLTGQAFHLDAHLNFIDFA
jgi:hypothetical protein